MSTAVGDRKRRADALDAVSEGKRQTFSGQTAKVVIKTEPVFAEGTKPERKVEAFVPLPKELKAPCQYQNITIKQEKDVEGWRQLSTHVVAKYDAERQGWEAQQGDYESRIKKTRMLVAALEQNKTELTDKITETEARLAAEKDANGSLQRKYAGLEVRLAKQEEENANKLKEKDEEIRSQKKYAENLQTYNTALHADVTAERARVVEAQQSSIEMQGQLAELGGKVRSMEQWLTYEREQVAKLRNERETATRDMATLRADLDNTRQERDRAMAELAKAKEDLDRVRVAVGKNAT